MLLVEDIVLDFEGSVVALEVCRPPKSSLSSNKVAVLRYRYLLCQSSAPTLFS